MQSAKMRESVAIVGKHPEQLGGAWIHTGTIPYKILRESMDQIHSIGFHVGSNWVERIINDLSTTKPLNCAQSVVESERKLLRNVWNGTISKFL